MFASGVFSSWVTDETKSERIAVSATPARTARMARISPSASVSAAAAAASSASSAPCAAPTSAESVDWLVRIVQVLTAGFDPSATMLTDGSRNSSGNSRTSSGAAALASPDALPVVVEHGDVEAVAARRDRRDLREDVGKVRLPHPCEVHREADHRVQRFLQRVRVDEPRDDLIRLPAERHVEGRIAEARRAERRDFLAQRVALPADS